MHVSIYQNYSNISLHSVLNRYQRSGKNSTVRTIIVLLQTITISKWLMKEKKKEIATTSFLCEVVAVIRSFKLLEQVYSIHL